ncbi:MAG: hypothetical protein FJZ78_04490 [Bacteroidetes bacterium]|nr:hypothetical protein [Bacteroidota bacterium]
MSSDSEENLPKKESAFIGSRRFFKRLDQRVRNITSIAGRLLIVVLVVALLTFLIREWTADGYVIQQINVPEDLAKSGYTGPVIANRIRYNLEEIVENTRLQENAQAYKSASEDLDLSVDLIGVGVPVRAVIDMLGSAIGFQRKKLIHADIFISDSTIHSIIKITDAEPEHFQVALGDNLEDAVKQIVAQSSEAILKYTNDGILQRYYLMSLSPTAAEKAALLASFRLEKYKGYAREEAAVLADWAMGLVRQGKLELAEEKILEGLAKDSSRATLYIVWGALKLQTDASAEDIIEKFDKADALLTPEYPKIEQVRVYNNKAVTYIAHNSPDSAFVYLRKALEVDPKFNIAWMNLALGHLKYKQDTVHFLEYMDKAMAAGLNRANLRDPDLDGVRHDSRFLKLIQKYSE